MAEIVIRAEGLSKRYQLGVIGYGSLRHDLQAWWAKIRGRDDPNAKIGEKSRIDLHGDFWALRGLAFEVRHGERVGIIGKNGAGKSTLLKILSRITRPTDGVVRMKGKVSSLLEVGTGFHPELTGRENVFLNGAIMGMKRREIERKLDEIVGFAGVEEFIDTPVKRYSSGMYVRLGFSVAAHLEPDILIVDEVLAVGDAAFQKKCLGKMEEISQEGRTVLFVSHNMFSIQNFCNRGLLLDAGQIIQDGEVSSVVARYMGMSKKNVGEILWSDAHKAPGDERLRLVAVRVVSGGETSGNVVFEDDFDIEADYLNLERDSKRLVSFHVTNAMGVTVLTSANMPSACVEPDPWYDRDYPHGTFRTSCTIPGGLLNEGEYTVSVFINVRGAFDNIVILRDVLSFSVIDRGSMRKEYTETWLGVVRPRLEWKTEQLS